MAISSQPTWSTKNPDTVRRQSAVGSRQSGWFGRTARFLLLTAFCLLPSALKAWGDAAALLRKQAAADRRVTYSGTKTVRYARGEGKPEREWTVRMWHLPPDKTRFEVLPPAEAAGMVSIEVGDHRSHYLPWGQRWLVFPGKRYRPPVEILLRNYVVREVATDTVAGRRARVLFVRPRYPGNRQEKIWLDAQTGIALKNEILDGKGKVVSAWQFQAIQFPRLIPSSLFTTPTAMQENPMRESAEVIAKPAFLALTPHYLPPGFVEVRRTAFRRHGSERVVLQYTDGLNSIVFMQERRGPADAPGEADGENGPVRRHAPEEAVSAHRHHPGPPPPEREGEMAAHRRWTVGDLRLTLVGGVEQQELDRMAASVSTSPAAGKQVSHRR